MPEVEQTYQSVLAVFTAPLFLIMQIILKYDAPISLYSYEYDAIWCTGKIHLVVTKHTRSITAYFACSFDP